MGSTLIGKKLPVNEQIPTLQELTPVEKERERCKMKMVELLS